MRKTLFGLLASTALVFGACQGATSPSPSSAASSNPSTAPSGSTAASESPAASGSAAPTDANALLYAANYQPEQGQPGGKVIISDWQAANQLNPYFSNAFANTEVFASTMVALLDVSADGHWYPELAAEPITFKDSVKKDASGTGFTVHAKLKPSLKWSDGQPLTMDDVKFTHDWVLDKDQKGVSTLGWETIDKVTVSADKLEADFHFPKPFAGWLGTIGGNAILPQHYIKTFSVKDGNKTYPLNANIAKAPASGPFKYVTASPDTIELARNENWAAAGKHAPYLDAVTYKFFPDNKDGMIAAFKNGEIDVALDLVQDDYDAIKDVDPSIGKAILEPAWLYEHLDMNEAGLGKGKGDPALQDVNVRKAIYQAIDKKAMYQTVFPGAPLPDQEACSNATPTNYWYKSDLKCPTFDVAAANKLLDDGGYTKNPDGTRNGKDGKPLVFEHCTSDADFRKTGGQFIANSLKQIGITLNLNFVDSTNVLFANWPDVSADTKCNLAHGNYDTSEFAYVLSFDLFGDYYYSYASEQIPTDANKGNGYNYLRLKDPDMDSAINVLKNAIDPNEQLKAAQTIQQVYADKVPEVALYYRNEARGVNVKLHNFQKNPSTQTDMWNIEDWWMTQ
jgi:peptide/nickel transport system substrate-binding protein